MNIQHQIPLVVVVGFIIVIALSFYVRAPTIDFCQAKGFETGSYYSSAEGTYCWDSGIKVRSNGSEYAYEINRTFFPDKIKSGEGDKQ